MKFLLGIVIGGGLAMIFPEQAASGFEFVRDGINNAASYIADQTREPTEVEKLERMIEELK